MVRMELPSSTQTVTVAAEMAAGGLTSNDIVTVCIYTVIGSIGLVGNALVLLIFRLLKSRKSRVNYFILSQALSDFVTSVFLILFGATRLVRSEIHHAGFVGEFLCRFWWSRFFVFSCFAISTFNLTAMSVERFIAVVVPLKYPVIFSKRNTLVVIVCVWAVAPTMQWIFPIWLHALDEGTNSCVFQSTWSFQVAGAISGGILFAWEYFIPVLFMLIAYVTILRTLKRKQNQIQALGASKKDSAPAPGTHFARKDSAGQPSKDNRSAGIRFVVADGNGNNRRGENNNNIANPTSNNTANGNPNPGSQLSKTSKVNSAQARRRNVTVTLFIMFIMYVICWTPNQLTFLQFNLGGSLDFNKPWYHVTVFMAFVNTCINPCIYALKHKQFQNGLLVFLRCSGNAREGRSQTSFSVSGTVVD